MTAIIVSFQNSATAPCRIHGLLQQDAVELAIAQEDHRCRARHQRQELMQQATGKPLTASAYLRYLEAKYLEAP